MSEINKMVQLFEAQAKNNDLTYEYVVEKIASRDYDYIPEENWALIIDEVWKMAYQKALSDNVLTPEENYNLAMISALSNDLKTPGFRQSLQYKLNFYVKAIENENKYEPVLKYPKPNPWNWENKKDKNKDND